MVYGKVLQWVTWIGRPRDDESAPLGGAVVTLENADQRFTYVTQSDGAYSFNSIPEGKYKLSAQLNTYTAEPASYEVILIIGGCKEVFIQLKALASIKGVLLDAEGKPATKKRVELLRRNEKGKWYSTFKMWTQTDEKGSFKFEDIESGDYLLGYEIWGHSPSNYTPYPTLYYPGVSERSEAAVITLIPQQERKGLQLRLLKPHTERKIIIKVIKADGKPPGKNLLQIFNQAGLIQNLEGTQHGGVLTFKGYQEREYEFSARYWIDNLGGGGPVSEKRLAKSEIVKLSPGKEDTEVVIVLSHIPDSEPVSPGQIETQLIVIKERIAKTTPEGLQIIEKVKGMRPEINEKVSAKTLGEILKDFENGKERFKLTAIGWETSQKQTGNWRVIFHYQNDESELIKAEWEYNPKTNKLYPFEFPNAPAFWTKNGEYK